MTPLNTIIEEEKKDYAVIKHIAEIADKHCPDLGVEHQATPAIDIINRFVTTAMQRAYEAGREHWLRSEIEKLEKEIRIADGVPDALTYVWQHGHNKVLTSIITRYKEELKVLESKI